MTRMIAALCFGVACSATVAAAQSGSAMADHYMLNSATVSAGEMMKNDAMSADHPMSFALSGGDLKSHIGHKVEVTGTISKKGHMDKDKMSAMAESAPKAATLKVKTVKMLSSTCS